MRQVTVVYSDFLVYWMSFCSWKHNSLPNTGGRSVWDYLWHHKKSRWRCVLDSLGYKFSWYPPKFENRLVIRKLSNNACRQNIHNNSLKITIYERDLKRTTSRNDIHVTKSSDGDKMKVSRTGCKGSPRWSCCAQISHRSLKGLQCLSANRITCQYAHKSTTWTDIVTNVILRTKREDICCNPRCVPEEKECSQEEETPRTQETSSFPVGRR